MAGGGLAPGTRGGGRRTIGFPFSVVMTVCREMTDPAGEGYPSCDGGLPNDDLRLIATLGVYVELA